MKTKRFTLVLCLLILFIATTFGQNNNTTTTNKENKKYDFNTWSVTLSGGSMLFYGDLRQFDFYPISKKNSTDWYDLKKGLSERDKGFSLSATKQITSIFGIQGMIETGGLQGVKIKADEHFKTSFITYGLNLKVDFLPIFNPNIKDHKINVYCLLGFGLIDFKSLQTSISTGDTIHSYGYGQYGQKKKRTTEVYIPLGLGVKYKINKKFDVGLESTIYNVNTDKLDAHKKVGTAKDKYGYTAITLTYKIGKKDNSLDWVAPKEPKSDTLKTLISTMNKMIDSLGKKLKEVDAKSTQLQSDVAKLKNPPVEADDDGDGVPNSRDLEPNTPKGNLVNFQGVTIPKATAAGTASNSNVTNNTTNNNSVHLDYKAAILSVFFPVNGYSVDDLNIEKIASAVVILEQDSTLKLDLVGHADKTGGQLYNDILSKKRAESVYNILVKTYGDKPNRINVIGVGVKEPMSANVLSINRRVDFFIKK